jgi:hypothetical protein
MGADDVYLFQAGTRALAQTGGAGLWHLSVPITAEQLTRCTGTTRTPRRVAAPGTEMIYNTLVDGREALNGALMVGTPLRAFSAKDGRKAVPYRK